MKRKKHLLLVGGGHAQLSVLAALATVRLPNVEVTLVTPSPYQYYSGMLPSWMVGRYHEAQCRIDLRPLAQKANVHLMQAQVVGINAEQHYVELSNENQLDYDWLSLDIGSEVDLCRLSECGDLLLPAKPLAAFYAAWPKLVARANASSHFNLGVVGGGAAGAELALAAHHCLKQNDTQNQITLVTGERGLLPNHAAGVRRRIIKKMQTSGIVILPQNATGHVKGLQLGDGQFLRMDAVIAASGARAPTWLKQTDLTLDANGFISVDTMHRSLSHPSLFAVGDICSRTDSPLARSGVHAVHAGPVLAHNLLATITGKPLKPYTPRKRSLYLLALGDGRAVMSWGRFSAEGKWLWRWKDHIDRQFIQKNQGQTTVS